MLRLISCWGAATLLLGLLAACGEESASPEGADQSPAGSPSDSPAEEATDQDNRSTVRAGTRDRVRVHARPVPARRSWWPPVTRPDALRRHRPGDLSLRRGDDLRARLLRGMCEGLAARAHRRPSGRRRGRSEASCGHDRTQRRQHPGDLQRHPLYFYAHEGKNEVLCHDVFLNGGNWYVVHPDGDAAFPGPE